MTERQRRWMGEAADRHAEEQETAARVAATTARRAVKLGEDSLARCCAREACTRSRWAREARELAQWLRVAP